MPEPIDPGVDIGHVHLKVADIDRALELLLAASSASSYSSASAGSGFRLRGRLPPPHRPQHMAVQGGSPRRQHDRSLPLRDPLPEPPCPRRRLRRSLEAGVPLGGASDHGVSEALYLSDPTATASSSTGTVRAQEWPHPSRGRRSRCTRARSTWGPARRAGRLEPRIAPTSLLERLGAGHHLHAENWLLAPM